MLRRPHDDRTIYEIQNCKMTARRPGGDRTANSRFLQLLQVCRTAAVRPPEGRCEAAVRFSRHPRKSKNACHLTVIANRPHDQRTMPLQCGCGVSALRSLKKYNVKLTKTRGLRWPCSVLKTVRSLYSLHKNRKVTARFMGGGLRSPYGHRKHTASYMWSWHNPANSLPWLLMAWWCRDSENIEYQ